MPRYYYLRRYTEQIPTSDDPDGTWFSFKTIGPATDVVLQLRDGDYNVAELVIDKIKYKRNYSEVTFDEVFSKRTTSKMRWYIVEESNPNLHNDIINFNGVEEISYRY